MNMSQELYREELKRQMDNVNAEIQALINDYHSATDVITKSQIKTFLEKKEHIYLNLMERYYGVIK